MKNPKELWEDMTLIGKIFVITTIPTYYLTVIFVYTMAIIIGPILRAWEDFTDET